MDTAEVKKVYLIDSENVGDVWVTHIMEFAKTEDEIIVFYTQKSPYMCYENIRKLMETDREIIFIKCVEGQNALDFQLVTELGYRIGNEEEIAEYVVVTNDTGFDAAVRYWKAKGKLVKRYNARFCQLLLNQYRNQIENEEKDNSEKPTEEKKDNTEKSTEQKPEEKDKLEKSTEEKDNLEKPKEEILESSKMAEESQLVSKDEETSEVEILKLDAEKNIREDEEDIVIENEEDKTQELICSLLSCIGKNNISDFHNALVIFLGEEKGKEVYKEIKGNISEYATKKNMKEKEKFKVYCQLVFAQDIVETEYPKNFSNFVYDAKEKRGNLNTFRATLLEKFGKEKGMVYYNIIKPHVKILNRIQNIK
ncbi:MAG: hypothetical protein K2N51_18965 [Lachnospiraceae bacterium]|nr:hypothetical protein [Lachnospiraceae bacterium]